MSRSVSMHDILLCDLDAFFASVEQHDNPEYRGKPVIVGGSPRARGVVATCSYEARTFGVHSAMPMGKALKLCPHSILLPVNMRRYREISEEVLSIFERFTPEIEPVSIDEAYLAVKNGTGLKTAEAIQGALRGELGTTISISIGISTNKLLSKIACELAKPDGIKTLWAEDVPRVVWPLPAKTLPGIGPKSQAKLLKAGIRTVGDLASVKPEFLQAILGNAASTFQKYSLGVDDRKIYANRPVKSISRERTFAEDISASEYVFAVLMELAEGIGYRLRTGGFKAKTISLKLRSAAFRTLTRDLTLAHGTDSDLKIYRAAQKLFERHCVNPPWRLVGIRVTGLERCKQLTLLQPKPQELRERKIGCALDSLRTMYGSEVVYRARRLLARCPPAP